MLTSPGFFFKEANLSLFRVRPKHKTKSDIERGRVRYSEQILYGNMNKGKAFRRAALEVSNCRLGKD